MRPVTIHEICKSIFCADDIFLWRCLTFSSGSVVNIRYAFTLEYIISDVCLYSIHTSVIGKSPNTIVTLSLEIIGEKDTIADSSNDRSYELVNCVPWHSYGLTQISIINTQRCNRRFFDATCYLRCQHVIILTRQTPKISSPVTTLVMKPAFKFIVTFRSKLKSVVLSGGNT